MSSLKIWNRVPDGSTLEISVRPSGAAFASNARLVEDNGNETTWNHTDLSPGPKKKKLGKDKSYTVRLRVAFAGSTQTAAEIGAQIIKPDGKRFGSAYSHTVRGRDGDIRRATIIAVTEQSQNG